MLKGIRWLGHASFRIIRDVVIYIDPWKVKRLIPADLILITHGHYDHLSIEDIQKLSQPGTVIITPTSGAAALTGDMRVIAPGQSLRVGSVLVEAVPAYNLNKPNHPQTDGNVGYIVQVGGQRIYHAGDSDLIPEMANIRCDIALLPIGGTYTMNADEAVQAVEWIRPQVVVPMHWGDIVGSRSDVQRFKKQLKQRMEQVKVVVMRRQELAPYGELQTRRRQREQAEEDKKPLRRPRRSKA